MECGSNLNAAESGLDKLVQDEKLNYLPVYIFYYVLLMECGSIAVVFLPLIKSVLEKFTCVYFWGVLANTYMFVNVVRV